MRHWMTRLAVVAAATATIGFCLPVASANAAVGGVRLSGGMVRFGPLTASGQAGYIDVTSAASVKASDKFVVPNITGCTATDTLASFGDVIFNSSGALQTAALVIIGCQGGSPASEAIIYVNGAFTGSTWAPQPGDHIKAVSKESGSAASATLTDTTQAMSVAGSAATGAANGAVLDGSEAVSTSSSGFPVPDFSTVTFTAGTIDGVTIHASGAVKINMNTTGSQVQIKATALTSAGNSFKEKFVHA